MVARFFPNGTNESFLHNVTGLVGYTSPLQQVSRYLNDLAFRPIAVTNANNHTIRFQFSAADDLLSLTNSNQKPTRWSYDAYGRPTAHGPALGR